jgi:hypothetical protein
LVERVAKCLGGEVTARRELARGADPVEEARHQRADVLIAQGLALRRWCAAHDVVRGVDRANPQQALQTHRIAADGCLEEVPTTMCSTADESHTPFGVVWWAVLEDVVDIARVGLEVAAEAVEQLLNELAGVMLGVREQDRVVVDDRGEEMALLQLRFAREQVAERELCLAGVRNPDARSRRRVFDPALRTHAYAVDSGTPNRVAASTTVSWPAVTLSINSARNSAV